MFAAVDECFRRHVLTWREYVQAYFQWGWYCLALLVLPTAYTPRQGKLSCPATSRCVVVARRSREKHSKPREGEINLHSFKTDMNQLTNEHRMEDRTNCVEWLHEQFPPSTVDYSQLLETHVVFCCCVLDPLWRQVFLDALTAVLGLQYPPLRSASTSNSTP